MHAHSKDRDSRQAFASSGKVTPPMAGITINERVRAARERLSYSQAQAARACGVSESTWQDYETPGKAVPKVKLPLISERLLTSEEYLRGETEEISRPDDLLDVRGMFVSLQLQIAQLARVLQSLDTDVAELRAQFAAAPPSD